MMKSKILLNLLCAIILSTTFAGPESELKFDKEIKEGEILSLNERIHGIDLEVMFVRISGIDFQRAPGGKISRLVESNKVEIVLKCFVDNSTEILHLIRTKSEQQPKAKWKNTTLQVLNIKIVNNKVTLEMKIEVFPIEEIRFGERIVLHKAESQVITVDGLKINYRGLLTSHTIDLEGKSGNQTLLNLELDDRLEKKLLRLSFPLKKDHFIIWKKWSIQFLKTDEKSLRRSSGHEVSLIVKKN